MKIKTFLETAGSFDEREILLKFHKGILRSKYGSTDKFQNLTSTEGAFIDIGSSYSSCDVAVMLGSWKNRDRSHHVVRSSISENAHCFVVIETPLLGRSVTHQNIQHRIGVNGFLNNSGIFFINNCPSDRFDRLGIEWNGWKNNPDGEIVVMLQLPGDASLRNIDIYEWANYIIRSIRKISNRPIAVRTHPLHTIKDSDGYHKFVSSMITEQIQNLRFSVGNKIDFVEDIKNAYCTVTYSSGSGIDSIIHGIPTMAVDPGNFAWNISSNFINEINSIKLAQKSEVMQWFYNLAYSQWSVDEMASGRAWDHIFPIVNNVIQCLPKKKK